MIREFFKIFIVSGVCVITMCQCEQKKLPQQPKNIEKFEEIFSSFLDLDKSFMSITDTLTKKNTKEFSFLERSFKTNLPLSKEVPLDDELSKFEFFLGHVHRKYEFGLDSIAHEFHDILHTLDKEGIVDFYINKSKRDPGLYTSKYISSILEGLISDTLVLKNLLELSYLSDYLTSIQQIEFANFINHLIIHYASSNQIDKSYPKVYSKVLTDALTMYILERDNGIVFNKIDSEIRKINGESGLGSENRVLDYELNSLLLIEDPESFESLIQNVGRSNIDHFTLDSYASKKLTYGYNFLRRAASFNSAIDSAARQFYDVINRYEEACAEYKIYAVEYFTTLKAQQNEAEIALPYIEMVKECDSLEARAQFSLERAQEIYNSQSCNVLKDFDACDKSLKHNLLSDSIMESEYSEAQLHLSDHFAMSAQRKFAYLKNMEMISGKSEYTQSAFDFLQNTKYRIFNLNKESEKIYKKSVLRKIKNLEEKINEDFISITNNEDATVQEYVELCKLYVQKMDLQKSATRNEKIQTKSSQLHLPNIQSILRSHEAQAIEFYQFENSLSTFVVTPDTFYFENRILSDTLLYSLTYVKNHQNTTKAGDTLIWHRSVVLDTFLTPYLDTDFENLILIPDGIFNNIAYEALEDHDGTPLSIRYNCSYSYGINEIGTWVTPPLELKSAYFVSYSDQETQMDRSRKKYFDLLGAEKEVKNCSEQIADARVTTKTGFDCTKKTITKALKKDIAHIATHAFSNPNSNLENYLVTRKGKDYERIYGFEIENLDVRSRLAVLSACETGVGQYYSGEGVFSLSRSLRQAGVETVIKTLWKVDDAKSYHLVNNFYKYLTQGYSPGESLAKAKAYFRKYHSDDPYYWAAYVLEGNPFLEIQ